MARTKGSGWGAGTILYQKCPKCGRKKAMYDPFPYIGNFKCTWCKERFNDGNLKQITYKKQLTKQIESNH